MITKFYNEIKTKIAVKLIASLKGKDFDAVVLAINNVYLDKREEQIIGWRMEEEFQVIAKGVMAKVMYDTITRLNKEGFDDTDIIKIEVNREPGKEDHGK